jgi:hypothetical protein
MAGPGDLPLAEADTVRVYQTTPGLPAWGSPKEAVVLVEED